MFLSYRPALVVHDDFEYRANAHPAGLSATDALHLALDFPHLITTPNATYIPIFEPEPCSLRPRIDGKFGMEDYTAHPQVFHIQYPWIPCIRRKPVDIADLERHEFWELWNPCWRDTFTPLNVHAFDGRGVMEWNT